MAPLFYRGFSPGLPNEPVCEGLPSIERVAMFPGMFAEEAAVRVTRQWLVAA